MRRVPVEFEYDGKHYKGELIEVPGAGVNMYHLQINNYYQGQLFLAESNLVPGEPKQIGQEKYEWRFATNDGIYPELAEYFAQCIEDYIKRSV